MKISQLELKELLSYDPSSGEFYWIKPSNNRMVGKRAGSINSTGRRHIKIGDYFYKEHRLAWLYMHGSMPESDIDHIDRNPLNNRIQNLRLATKAQNSLNRGKPRTSNPAKGVRFVEAKGKWRCYGTYKKRSIHIGYFDDLELATLVSEVFREKFHGDYFSQV